LKLCGQFTCHTPCRIHAAPTFVWLEDDVALAIDLNDCHVIDHALVACIVQLANH
jgi:hypothetical protein